MTDLLEIKEKIKNIYAKYDIYIIPLFKFIMALCVFSIINGNIGYMGRLNSLPVVLVLSLLCALLPVNAMILLAAVVVMLHLYALALEVAVVGLILFLVILLLYYRFSPKDGVYAMLMPVCLHFYLGPVLPIVVGLKGKVYSVISLMCGTIVWFFLDGVKQNAAALGSKSEEASFTSKFSAALNPIIANKEMYLVVLTCLLVTVIVFFIRSLSIDYAWTVAILVGDLLNFIIIFAGYMMLEVSGKTIGLIVGSLIALAVAFLLEFVFFNLDYSRTERVQFEDDEYYYYVKAVPKMYVAEKEKQVKTYAAKRGSHVSKRQYLEDDE